MPDHIHLFVTGGPEFNLGIWVRGLKRVVAAAVAGGRADLRSGTASPSAASDGGSCNIWQRGFFDHLLRNSESYAQKWDYVLENPVRAGLVSKAKDWPFAGEIVESDRV
jgi:REP element-mobilizing transposase RayT